MRKNKIISNRPVWAQEIIKARKAKGMTQQQLAKAIGRSVHTIKNYELGETTPSFIDIDNIGKALGIVTLYDDVINQNDDIDIKIEEYLKYLPKRIALESVYDPPSEAITAFIRNSQGFEAVDLNKYELIDRFVPIKKAIEKEYRKKLRDAAEKIIADEFKSSGIDYDHFWDHDLEELPWNLTEEEIESIKKLDSEKAREYLKPFFSPEDIDKFLKVIDYKSTTK